MGLTAIYTRQAAEKVRPEQQGLPGADHVGFGTLLYSRMVAKGSEDDINTIPAAPAGLLAKTSLTGGNTITWVASIAAKYYAIKRAEQKNGPYTILANNITKPLYQDNTALKGKTYYYVVSAFNKSGESVNAYPVNITTAFRANWKQSYIGGEKHTTGPVIYDGRQFTIEADGIGIDSLHNQFKFIYTALNGDGTITARYVPQISSQFSGFGLVVRDGLAANMPQVALMVKPELSGQPEAPRWFTRFYSWVAPGNTRKIVASSPVLAAPVVTFSRLTGYYWLRLQRKGEELSGYSSIDGKSWVKIGSIAFPIRKQVLLGLAVASGLETVSTTVYFDEVDLKKR